MGVILRLREPPDWRVFLLAAGPSTRGGGVPPAEGERGGEGGGVPPAEGERGGEGGGLASTFLQ